MQRALSLIVKNHQSQIPPNEREVKAFIDGLESTKSHADVKIPSEIKGCLAFLCSRQAVKDSDFNHQLLLQQSITWLVKATLLEISYSSSNSSNDPFYGLRVLLSGKSIPMKLNESEFQKLVANSGEIDISSSTQSVPPPDSSKKKIKKAQIAKELRDDILLTLSPLNGDNASRFPVSYSAIARNVFWKEQGHEILANCLQNLVKSPHSAAQEDLASFAKKGYLLCQILHGAISSQANPDFTLNSLPVMYANNWIKSIFKIMAAITQDLAKYLFSRNSKSFDAPIFSAEVFDNMVLLQEAFFSLFSTTDGRQVESFERDAAHLWFNLCLVSSYCSPSHLQNAFSPLILLAPRVNAFVKFTAFALESLRSELIGPSGSTSVSSDLVNQAPWVQNRECLGNAEMSSSDSATPHEWSRKLTAMDAYERFILEADFRQSLVLASPLDICLLDLATAFFFASKEMVSESSEDSASLLKCAENAISALCSFLQLRETRKPPSAILHNKEAFIQCFVHFMSLHPESLGHPLTALFFTLAPTPFSPAILERLHLLPPDLQLAVEPASFRLLATYLLDASCSSPAVVESYCLAAVRVNFSDLSPHLAQLISLLTAAFTTHSAKKNLLSAIIDTLITRPTIDILRALRLVVLLRYQLHYIFDPPRHLNSQVRPAILGSETKVYEFPNLVNKGTSSGFFYDLLYAKGKTDPTPQRDGLAIATLVARSDYDVVFMRLLELFDTWWEKSPSLLYSGYGAQLSWRLLEILPPSADYVDQLSALANGDEFGSLRGAINVRHRLVYLLVFLDRLRRLPTGPNSPSSNSSEDKEAKRNKHRIESIANETFKAQTSRGSRATGHPVFSNASGYESFFLRLSGHTCHLSVVLSEALHQLRYLQERVRSTRHLSETELIFWRIVLHTLRTLVSRISPEGCLRTPGELPPTSTMVAASSKDKKEDEAPKNKEAVRVCSTGTQSSDSVGGFSSEAIKIDTTGEKKKKMNIKSHLFYFLDSFMQIAVDIMRSLLQQLEREVGFSNSKYGKLVERLCPSRLVEVSKDPFNCVSLLLANPTTGRLVDALRRTTSQSSGDGSSLHAWKALVFDAGPLSWSISDSDTLSLILYNHLTSAPVESASTPRSLLLGCLLKETVEFADTLVQNPRSSSSSLLLGSPIEERQSVLSFLTAFHLNPLISTLGIDLSILMRFYAGLVKKIRQNVLLIRAIEKCVLNALVRSEVTDDGLRREVFSYLEVATGLPRVLSRLVKTDKEIEPLPLFEFLDSTPEFLRLMSITLLRAINPQSNPELHLEAAKKVLSKAVDCGVIVKSCRAVLTSSDDRYSRLVERLLRLIAFPWPSADEIKSKCLSALLDLIEEYDSPINGCHIISGLRCLLLASWNTTPFTHVRFVATLARWVDNINIQITKHTFVGDVKNDLIETLCASYDYFNLLLRALSPATNAPAGRNLTFPDPNFNRNRTLNAISRLKHPEMSKFFTFFSNADNGFRPGEGWNTSFDAYLLHALCGPVARSEAGIALPRLLSTLPFHSFVTSPLERACEEVCTFPTTQHHYIRQPWYGCATCGIMVNHGACHLCAQVCHHGHDLVYQTTSQFFCDCAAELGDSGKCRAVMRRVVADKGSVFGALMPWLNWSCLQRSIGNSTCELIAKAATRRLSTIFPEAVASSSSNSLVLSSAPVSSVVSSGGSITTASTSFGVAPALPPRNASSSDYISVENNTSETVSSRLRRAAGIRVRRPLPATGAASSSGTSTTVLKPSSSGVNASASVTEPPVVTLNPCLNVIYGDSIKGRNRIEKFFFRQTDPEASRRQSIEVFQQKFGGSRLQPFVEAVVERLRKQLSLLNAEDRDKILVIVRSPSLSQTACSLLKAELTSKSSPLVKLGNGSEEDKSFAEVFKHFSNSADLHASALEHLTSLSRTAPHRLVSSSSIVAPVFSFQSGQSIRSLESTASTIDEVVIPSPSPNSCANLTPIPSPDPVQAFTTVTESAINNEARGSTSGRPRLSGATVVSTSLPTWMTEILSSHRDVQHLCEVVATHGAISRLEQSLNSMADVVAFLTRIPSVNGEFKHFLVAATPYSSRQSHASYVSRSCVTIFQVDDLLFTAAECLDASTDSQSPNSLPLVVDISSLPQTCRINCGSEVSRLTPHPTNGSLCIASNTQNCVVFGLSPLGEVCGRLSITASLGGGKDEILIKPIWLPGSTRYLALLTTKSVQIFDIFAKIPKLLFHFKPVEGNFLDATFIYAPNNVDQQSEESSSIDYNFSDVVLIVMATFGSMLRQRLLPTTQANQGDFYLAECFEWEAAGLCELSDSDALSSGYLESLRNPSTGIIANGGASVFYSANLHLLFHSYISGHTFATALDVSPPMGLRVNHSFLLTGPKSSQSSESSGAVKKPIKGVAWCGPIRDWADVPGQNGMISATTGDSVFHNLLIAVEPDTIWIQALPTETQPILPESSSETSGNSNPLPKTAFALSNSPAVCTSVMRRWSGNENYESRLFVLQLAKSGAVQVFCGPPESHICDSTQSNDAITSDFVTAHSLPVTLPGQFWFQPALHPRCWSSSQSETIPMKPSSEVSELEDLLLWETCSKKKLNLASVEPDAIREFAAYALKALPVLRIVVERNRNALAIGDVGCSKTPFCDFHEWASPCKNVNFYSRDLLHIYNHDALNHRLKQSGMPIVFTGSSCHYHKRQSLTTTVAFTIDIGVLKPAEEIIVGLRVELADANRPEFLSIFGRKYNVNEKTNANNNSSSQAPTKQSVFVDLPLALSEILQLKARSKVIDQDLQPIRLSVGQSKHSDALTSIDRILVYTVPRALLDPSFLIHQDDLDKTTQVNESTNWQCFLNTKETRVANHNASLVKWFDRLMFTGFVTCAVTKPFVSLGEIFESEFTTPLYGGVKGKSSVDFIASLTDFFQSILDFEQISAKPEIAELKSVLKSAIPKTLSSTFLHPRNVASNLATNLIRLHGIIEDTTTNIILPTTILTSLVSEFLDAILGESCREHLLNAYSQCFNRVSGVWQLAHEYNQGDCSGLSTDCIVRFFTTLKKNLLEIHPPHKTISPEENVSWVKLLQALLKISILVLAESFDRDQKAVSVVGDLIVDFLVKSHPQIACNTRDILSSSLITLFSSGRSMTEILLESIPRGGGPDDAEEGDFVDEEDVDDKQTAGASSSVKKLKSNASSTNGNSRLKRIRRPRFTGKRSNRLPASTSEEIDEIGRNLSEILQFIATTANIQEVDEEEEPEGELLDSGEPMEIDDSGVNYGGDSRPASARRNRRTRWDGALSDLHSVQQVMDEITRSIRGVRGRIRIPSAVLRDCYFLEKVEDEESEKKPQQSSNANGPAPTVGSGAESRQPFAYRELREAPGTASTIGSDMANRETSGDGNASDGQDEDSGDSGDDEDDQSSSSEEEIVETTNLQGTAGVSASTNASAASADIVGDDDDDDDDDGGGGGGGENSADMAPHIIQHILDLVSSQSQDVSALAAGIQGSGSNSENSDNLQTESGLFEAAILGNIDEEAILNLALQRSLRDQGGPGTAAMLEEQAVAEQSRIAHQDEIIPSVFTNVSNARDEPATSGSKSTVSTQVLPPNSGGNEVERRASRASVGSECFDEVLPTLFEVEDENDDAVDVANYLPLSPPSSECNEWSFASDFSDDGDDKSGKDKKVGKKMTKKKYSNDGDDPMEPSPGSFGPTKTLSPSPDRQSLCAARACIALMRYFMTIWPDLLSTDESFVIDSRHLIPLLQTTFTLSRLLEAVAQCAVHPEASEDIKKVAECARNTLVDLVTGLSSWFYRLYQNKDVSTLKSSPSLERLLLVANLLSRMLILQPTIPIADGREKKQSQQAIVTPTSLLIGKQVFISDDADGHFTKCMDTCLNIVKSLHSRLQSKRDWQLDENASSSAALQSHFSSGMVSPNLPYLATGLYQCSLGVNFSSLSNGFGSGLTNSAPLLDSQICMEKLSGALNFDFELQVTEAAVQLVIALLSARGTEDSRKEQKTTWCNVAYDLIELLTTDEGEPGSASSKSTGVVAESEAVKALKCSPIASSRLAGLMRSLLIILVGSKHYRQLKDVHLLKQTLDRMQSVYDNTAVDVGEESTSLTSVSFYPTALSYPSECLMLNCINTCLDVALVNRSTWVRLSVRKPECFVFMLEASLRVRDILAQGLLSLVLLAVLQDSDHVCVASRTDKVAESSSANKKFFNNLAQLIIAEDASSNLLLNFIRGNVCCRADQRIRFSSASILIHLAGQCRNGSFAAVILKHLPQLWSELPAFAIYGDELSFLTLNILQLQPKGAGVEMFVSQLMQLLLTHLNIVADHPRRDIYKSLIREYTASRAAVGTSNRADDASWTGLHLPSTFISSIKPPSYSPALEASQLISCPSDSEPCLLCNQPLESCMPFVNLHWNTHTPSRRRGLNGSVNSSTGASTSAYLNASSGSLYPFSLLSFENHLPPTAASTSNSAGTTSCTLVELEPLTSVSPNVHIFSLHENWQIGRIVVQFSIPTASTHNVRTLNIFTADAFECPPARLMHARHLWRRLVQVDFLPTKHIVVINLTSTPLPELGNTNDITLDPTNTVEINLSEGLPLHANALIFHYAAFQFLDGSGTNTSGTEKRRRRFCSRCNLPLTNSSTCSNCRQNGNQCSRCLFINLTDEEVFLCPKCGSSNYNFMNFYVAVRPAYSQVNRLNDEEDRRLALTRIVSLSEELNAQLANVRRLQSALFSVPTKEPDLISSTSGPLLPIHWSRDNDVKILCEMDSRLKTAVPTVCRLWSLRQSVALYDGRCSFILSVNGVGGSPCFDCSVGDDRCMRCVQATITLLAHIVLSLKPSLFSEDSRKECIARGIPLLNSLCAIAQRKLMNCICHITSNSIPLIDHFGDLLVLRLSALAKAADAMYDFQYSSSAEVSLLKINLRAIGSSTSPVCISRDKACLEARLRIFFRLIQRLTSSKEGLHPSASVLEGVVMDCVDCLNRFVVESGKNSFSFRAPRVNFKAWMQGDGSAAYNTWLKHFQVAQQMAAFAPLLAETKSPSRELVLSARYARRWRYRTVKASLPPLSSPTEAAEVSPAGGWLTSLLDHSFISHQHMCFQSAGVDFLTKLAFSKATSSSYRVADCLYFLLRRYVPRISSLVRANRGSGLSDELCINPLISLMWLLAADDQSTATKKMMLKRTLRAESSSVFVTSNSSTAGGNNSPTASMEPLILRPLLLSRGRILDYVEVLLMETLNSLASFEGVDGKVCELPQLRVWSNSLPSRLAPASGSGAAPSINAGHVMMHISDLLAILQPLNKLSPEYQNRLFSFLLRAIVVLQALVFQRSAHTMKAEALFRELLQQLMANADARAADFIRVTMDYLSQCPTDQSEGLSSVVFLLKRICDCACPLPGEIPPFPVRVSVWRDQEEYLFVRRAREVIMSNTRGFGPTIADVVNYICTENNLTTSILLEVVCEGNILMPNLLLEDIYKYLWLQNPNNVLKNTAMELVYRIAGLETDNLPYLSHLQHPTIPVEQYSRLALLTEHPGGFKVILSRLAGVRDVLRCRDLLHTSVHLLEYCLKVPECQASLLNPQLRTIPVLLDVLYSCLNVLQQQQQHAQSDPIGGAGAEVDNYAHFHDLVTSRLVGILASILHKATDNSEIENQAKNIDVDLLGLPRLLTCISLHPDLEVVQSGVAKLPGLLAFGSEARMAAIVDFLRQNAVQPLLIASDPSFDGMNKDLLQCCCTLVVSIPHNTVHGRRLRAKVVDDLHLLNLCVEFLWKTIPSKFLLESEETALDSKDEELTRFLNNPSLPFVLKLLRGCMWRPVFRGRGTVDPAPPVFPPALASHTTRQLLAFLHKLENSKSVGQVGLLCEDLFNEWLDAEGEWKVESYDLTTFDGVVSSIRELRRLSEERHRQNARAFREKYLLSLNMKVNEKGQVAITTANKLAEMAAQVVEETGLQCAICHDGPRSAPREELGIYAFIRRARLEESLTAREMAACSSTPSLSASGGASMAGEGYSTVSSFVVVHFECHAKAVRASTQNEWTVATRHNRDARCNCLLPVLMNETPPASEGDKNAEESKAGGGGGEKGKSNEVGSADSSMSELFAKRISAYDLNVNMTVSMSVSTRLSFHDIKLLILRFAHQRSFHGETGGGARESNLNLIPHLMQLAFYHMKKEQVQDTERANLMRVLECHESHWSAARWEATGPLYCTVVALHLFSRSEWDQHRATLLRHLTALAYARATADTNASEVPTFAVLKPYLLYFGLIQAFYSHFFKNVKEPKEPVKEEEAGAAVENPKSSTSLSISWWPEAVSEYIRASDDKLIAATPELLSFFENDLLPVESVDEFLDVSGMIGEVDQEELVRLATTGSRQR